jgi:hypothetical protein
MHLAFAVCNYKNHCVLLQWGIFGNCSNRGTDALFHLRGKKVAQAVDGRGVVPLLRKVSHA